MDSSHRDSRPQSARPLPSPQTTPNLQNSLPEGSDHVFGSTSEMNGPLRRGHSDGDVHGPPFRGPGVGRGTEEESWMDFLQSSSHPERDPGISTLGTSIRSFGTHDTARRQERQASMQRAALMMADRKRRLTEDLEDYNNRRSASSLPFGPTMTSPTGSRPSSIGHDWNFARPGRAPSSSIMDRPLPPRPDIASDRNRESREIILPSWQSDSEVTRCPICKTNFGFWYRKHHCRKCGRVVCANCSPHRITIPRQFIVQPPRDENQTAREGTSAGIEVVDLTEEEDTGVTPPSNTDNQDTPRSPPIRIDPALGGGQEVRLCNPCVPDPNPLPHLPFGAPDPSAMHSFPRPSFVGAQVPEGGSSDRLTSGFLRRSSSTRHSLDRVQIPGRHGGEGSSASIPGAREQEPDFSRFPSRHSSRLPPNFTSVYGSVPNHSLHEVSRRICTRAKGVLKSRKSSVIMNRWSHPYSCVIVIMPPHPMSHHPGTVPSRMRLKFPARPTRIQHNRSPNSVKKTNALYVTRRSRRKDPVVVKQTGKLMWQSALHNISPVRYRGLRDRIRPRRRRRRSLQVLLIRRKVQTAAAARNDGTSSRKVRG